LQPAFDFLVENGFTNYRLVGSQRYFDITPKGIRLEQEGGFAQLTKEKRDFLLYSKGSYQYATRAYYAAVIAIIIAIIIAMIMAMIQLFL